MHKIKVLYRPIFIFITLLILPSFSLEKIDGIAAVVGDSAILYSELEAYIHLKISQMGTEPDSLEMNIIRNQSLDELVDGKVLLVNAEKDTNISLGNYEVEMELNDRINMILRQNNISIDAFDEMLQSQQGITLIKFKTELRKQIRNELIKQKVQQLYVIPEQVTKKDVETFFRIYKDSLPVAGKSVLLSMIRVDCKASDSIRQVAFSKISAIKERLDKGEDFSSLAKQYSEGPNAAYGGDLGFISKGTLTELTFEEKAFSIDVGDISEPFETRLGFHIITVLAKKEQMVHIQQIFIQVKPPEEVVYRAVSLLDSVKKDSRTKEDFIKAVKLFSVDDVSKSRNGQLKWQLVSGLDPRIKQQVDSLEIGDLSSPIKTESGVSIFRVDDMKENRPLSLEEDWNEIAEIAQRINSQKKLHDLVKKWRQNTYIDIRL